jgi:tRNA/rRNA methyltransferase
VSRSGHLAIVLVEPEGPLNVGSVARLCANYGVEELRVVGRCCALDATEAVRMAVHGEHWLRQARHYPTLAEAVADRHRVVACSGRREEEALPTALPEDALAWMRAGAAGEATAVVFGRESRGLSNDELLLANRVLRIPTPGGHASLNLSHAVAVVLYELSRARSAAGPLASGQRTATRSRPAARAALNAFLEDAQGLLLEVGFLHPHTVRARMARFRALLQRSDPREDEVALMRGMVRQLRWATRRVRP